MFTKQFIRQRTKWLAKISVTLTSLLFLTSFTACKNSRENQLVIWTDNAEIVSYVELYNSIYDDAQAIVIYKAEPANSLPPAKDEQEPDIIIGPWLKNSNTRKNFETLDYLFKEGSISRSVFYKQVIEYGTMNDKQYLIPVCFNLPAVIFNRKNETAIENDHFLNLTQIKQLGGTFNKKNKSTGIYSAMGYGPSWDSDFLYLVTKLYGASYREKGNSFLWDDKALQNAISSIKEWTIARNVDTTTEQNFQFRYLFMPKYRQINSERCLFAYLPSDQLFTLTDAQSANISFRWIEQDGKIPVEDSIVSMGIYKKSKNINKAEKFIAWFFKEETQRAFIERTQNMKLDTVNFGIAGGFSSVKNVNEKIYPAYYRQLLGNLPAEEYLSIPYILPYQWPSIKSHVIYPYLQDSTNTSSSNVLSLESRISDWTKQSF